MTIAVVTNECQRGSIGDLALWPALREAAAPIVAPLTSLLAASRASGVPVVHVLSVKRPDLRASNENAPLFEAARRLGGLQVGTPSAQLIEELGPAATDVIVPKVAGLSPMHITDLDPILRNLGCNTIVIAGVSLNVAIPSLAFDAVNVGYRVVIPSDCVAGVPTEYAADVLRHSLSLVAEITTSDKLLDRFG